MIGTFFFPADDEVLIIKSVTHRDFNAMIKVSLHLKQPNYMLFFK